MDTEQLIQKHFNNNLSQDEQLIFNNLLLNDTNFKKEWQEFNDMHSVIKMKKHFLLKEELKALDKTKSKSYFSRALMTASFALLFLVGSYFIFTNDSLSNDELFTNNFNPYQNIMHPLVRGEENLSKIEKAFVFYEHGDYHKFIKTMESINYKQKDYNFYIANAYLAQEKTKEAKLILEDYIKDSESKFITKAHWYLGLIYLKLNDVNKAKSELEIVYKSGDFNSKKISKLLERIN